MPASVNAALRYIRALFAGQKAEGQCDQVLLEQFVSQRDESAFAALLQRHGPMAMGVCMRILHDEHLAEDAMQATFLVLALKASRLRAPGSLAGWLYGVALRLARKLKAQVLRSQRQVDRDRPQPPPATTTEASRREEKEVLDEEMERLPDKYRLPLLLCYFEGRTHEEAAAQLGRTPGQVKGLLDRGRERLRFRLSRRGVTLSAAAFATVLGETAWAATMISPRLAVPTVQAAMNLVSGKTLAECGVSASVVILVKGGLAMYPKKMLLVMALLLFGIGAAIWAANSSSGDPEGPGPEQPVSQKKDENGLLVLAEKKVENPKEEKKDDGDSAEEEAVIDRFIDILKNPKSPGRLAACEALGKRGSKAKRALPEIMKYLKENLEGDKDRFQFLDMVRWNILPATISVGGNGQETFDLLVNALKTKAAAGFDRDTLIACLGRFAVGCDKGARSKVRVELQVIAETETLSKMPTKALIVAKSECLGEIDYNVFKEQGKSLKLPAGTIANVEMLDGYLATVGRLNPKVENDGTVRVVGEGAFPSPGMHLIIVTGKDNKTGYIKVNVSHERTAVQPAK